MAINTKIGRQTHTEIPIFGRPNPLHLHTIFLDRWGMQCAILVNVSYVHKYRMLNVIIRKLIIPGTCVWQMNTTSAELCVCLRAQDSRITGTLSTTENGGIIPPGTFIQGSRASISSPWVGDDGKPLPYLPPTVESDKMYLQFADTISQSLK